MGSEHEESPPWTRYSFQQEWMSVNMNRHASKHTMEPSENHEAPPCSNHEALPCSYLEVPSCLNLEVPPCLNLEMSTINSKIQKLRGEINRELDQIN